ncbi:MAG: hypothetical protein LBH18_03090 [Spirochaetaceae bacterium]|jgi:hypothetical protein|nr:hypothetical protein [Spirochaetaceae bacterium]
MINRKFLLGMLAMVTLAFGVLLAGCGNALDKDKDDEYLSSGGAKEITITGLSGPTGITGLSELSGCKIEIRLFKKGSIDVPSAWGTGVISGNSMTIHLRTYLEPDWTDTGSYYSAIGLFRPGETTGSLCFYTDGKTFKDLGITKSNTLLNTDKLPELSITKKTTVVDFSQFRHQSND